MSEQRCQTLLLIQALRPIYKNLLFNCRLLKKNKIKLLNDDILKKLSSRISNNVSHISSLTFLFVPFSHAIFQIQCMLSRYLDSAVH